MLLQVLLSDIEAVLILTLIVLKNERGLLPNYGT